MMDTGQPWPGKKFHDKHRDSKLLKTKKKEKRKKWRNEHFTCAPWRARPINVRNLSTPG